jgi:2-iminobutanoate/2-iminopropanoate deaminase
MTRRKFIKGTTATAATATVAGSQIKTARAGQAKSKGKSNKQKVTADKAPKPAGPYSQAIVAGGLIFCSGMAGIDPASGTIPDGIEAQTEQALLNLAAVLAEAGASIDDVVKTTIFYADVEDFARLNEVYARHMPDPPPARSAPAHVRLPRSLLVSIEAIAVSPTS